VNGSALALVTGAPGWLGTRLVQTLFDGLPDVAGLGAPPPGRRVRCLVRSADGLTPDALDGRAETVFGDVTDAAVIAKLVESAAGATLFHAAGVVHPSRGVRELHRTNVGGTKLLLEAAKRAGVRRFIYVSSNSPIGCNPDKQHVFDESAPYNPYMHYGKSKRLAEIAVNEAGADGALETVIIRPPWFYGPNQPARQSLFFSMIKNGTVPLVGDGENRRSMAFIDNICQGLLLCEKTEAARGRTYWIADARPYSMNEIIDTIESVMESDLGIKVARKRRRLPGFASSVAYGIDATLQALGLYHQKIHVLSEMNKTIACSVERARKELGYDPKVDLRQGMLRSMKWMLERGQQF
jgi:nucleoside-diphosphate-sugar epimerase